MSNTLIVNQILPNGIKKSWKLKSKAGLYTFGTSRLADVISQASECEGIEAAFEYRQNQWYFLNLNLASESPSEMIIQTNSEKQLKGCKLQFQIAEEKVNLAKLLDHKQEAQGASNYQLLVIKHGQRIIETKVVKTNSQAGKTPITAENATIVRKNLQLNDATDLTRLQPQQMIDQESRQSAQIIIISCVFLGLVALLSPKAKNMDVVQNQVPAQIVKFKTQSPTKPRRGSVAEKKMQQLPVQPPPSKSTDNSGGGKVAGMLKGLNGGRISQLLGKVSAQAARSANVIVTNGIQAGTAASGQALSAIGTVEKSGRDWSQDASGRAATVATAGRGGGRNISGALSGGHVGQSGVGLIEDESEVVGGLDREIIAQYIKSQLGQILYCYERQLSANPDLFGKVAVRFTIGPQGQVESQNIGDSTLKNATVEGCILSRVATWKFPTPQGGTKVNVTYPFLFKSTN